MLVPPVELANHSIFPFAVAVRFTELAAHIFTSDVLGVDKLPTVTAFTTEELSLPQALLLTVSETVYVPAVV